MGFDLTLVHLHKLSTGFLQGFDGASTTLSTLGSPTGISSGYQQDVNHSPTVCNDGFELGIGTG
jgi:hypothetical protein